MMKLTELKARVEKIPEREKMKTLAELLKKYADELPRARKQLQDARGAVQHAASVFPALRLGDAERAADRSTSAARALKQMLDAQFDDISSSAARDHVLNMVEQAKASWRRVAEAWKAEVEARKDYQQLADALGRAGIPGSSELTAAMHAVLAHVANPPTTSAAANRVQRDVEVLHLAVEKLGLGERARAFLQAAARDGVRLKEVEDQAVRKMLNDYPQLGMVLRVRLG